MDSAHFSVVKLEHLLLAFSTHMRRRSIDTEWVDVHCGRCGKRLLVRCGDLRDVRVVECERCAVQPPFVWRAVYVVFTTTCTRAKDAAVAHA